jgi:hypothetical protein
MGLPLTKRGEKHMQASSPLKNKLFSDENQIGYALIKPISG